jgi:ankyrin repeat protein
VNVFRYIYIHTSHIHFLLFHTWFCCIFTVLKDILEATSEAVVLWAVKLQREDVLKAFIQEGAPVNKADSAGRVPIELAIRNMNASMLILLLANGADPNTTLPVTRDNMLQVAIECGSDDQVRMLIEQGADVNHCNGSGKSSLHIAALKGNVKATSLLLLAQAVPNLQDSDGNTALHITSSSEVLDLLLASNVNANPRIPNSRGQTPLHLAAKRGDVHVMQRLLEAGVSINVLDDSWRSPFHEAAGSGVPGAVLILLQVYLSYISN